MDHKYQKSGYGGNEGMRFQVSILTLFLLKALRNLNQWKLSTENRKAGEFDDVVLECPSGDVLLKTKYRMNKKKKITLEELLSTNTKRNDFSLPKYFLSYQEVKCRFKVKNIIVCTNAYFGIDTSFLITASSESMLYYEAGNCLCYTINDNILPDLKKNTKIYLQQCRNEVDESAINDDNLKDFLDHLQLYFNFPSVNEIENIIDRQLYVMRNICNIYNETFSTDIHSKMMDWSQQKHGEYLTEIHAKAMFFEIKRDKYWQKLELYDVFLQNNDLKFDRLTNIFHIVIDNVSLLREIQVYRILRHIKNVLCVRPESNAEEMKEILKTFELPKYTFITIIWPKVMEKSLIQEVTGELEQLLDSKGYKKVIFVTGNNNELTSQFKLRKLSHEVIHRSVTFDDFLEETKKNLLKKRIINFQGNTVNLEELFASKTTNDYGEALNSEVLEKLIRNEEVTVGREVSPLDLDIQHLYISRTLIRDDEVIEEEDIFEVNEKVILIADGPGMGKSTLLTNSAMAIKRKYPHLWVIKIVLSDYTRILNTSLRQNKRTLYTSELLDSQVETRLLNHLERYVFSMHNKVVLMFDGVDEVSPNYTELVENMIVRCQEAQNFAKIVVTSRPHVAPRLEGKLKAKSFKLQPFTWQNHVDYLTNYWTSNLGISYTDKAKCERYAEALLSQMGFSNRWYYMSESHFASIPLQVRMLAEIFQECTLSEHLDWQGCKEYLETIEMVPNLPKINLAKLFKMFLDKKRSVYLEKSNPSQNAMADLSVNKQFDECLEYHRVQALEVLLDKSNCEYFMYYKKNKISISSVESEVFNIGIIQKTDNGIHFIHRTFAEYFVAECLVRELQCQKRNVRFQKFLIEEILQKPEYVIVCTFFDSFLREILDFFPSNIFKEYQRSTSKVDEYPLYLMHDLAQNGYVAILQLIFKSINIMAVRPTNFKEFTPFRQRRKFDLFGKIKDYYVRLRYRNALNVLRYCLEQGGVNTQDKNGETPLDRAIDRGHLDMIKFLVEQGANINCDKPPSQDFNVPLYRAVVSGDLGIVKFLIEHGANIIPNTESSYVIYYKAVCETNADITEYLLEKIIEKDYARAIKYPFLPYMAAYLGRLNILIPLLRDDAAVKNRLFNGEPLLFGAARGGQLDTVRYLVEHGADVYSRDEEGNTALHIISKHSSLNLTIKLLKELGTDINVGNFNEETALHIAAARGNLDAVQLLIECGADVNNKSAKGSSPLQYAICGRHLNIVKLLIQNGANIDQNDNLGSSALNTAAAVGRLDIVKYLFKVRNNVDINFKGHTRSGYNALCIAIEKGEPGVVKFLLEFGVNENTKNSEEYQLLHSAVISGKFSTIKVLIDYGIGLNVIDEDGNTALHVAVNIVSLINKNIVELLVDSGVNVNVRNKNGHTALHALLTTSKTDCLRLVKELDINPYDERWKTMSEDAMVKQWRANCNKINESDERNLLLDEMHLATIIYLIKGGTDINLEDSQGNTVASLIKKGGQGQNS